MLLLWALVPGPWALSAHSAETLIATTVEQAPPEQQDQARSILKRLHLALNSCDGNRLYELLPSWERALVPAIAFDAVHGSADRIVGNLSLQQAAVSPYARAVLWLRHQRQPQRVDELGAAVVMNGWCEANRDLWQPLFGRLEADDWYWLRTDPHGLLSGCLVSPELSPERVTLVWQQEWRFALLESSEGQLLNAFASQPNAALLDARSRFIEKIGKIPAGARPDSEQARQALTATPDDPDLSAYAGLIERLTAIPPCG